MTSSTEAPARTFWTRCAGKTPRDRRNLRRAAAFYVAWAILFAGGSQLIKRGVVPEGAATWSVAALPSLFAAFVIAAAARFLREADELQRMIHLEAMALSFGGTWLGVQCYRILERAGAPAAGIIDATIFLALLYAIGLVRGAWRYR